ncbi:hypothetical protein ACRALDRAFT_1061335 [Sodiomyces alcalophilus JCM 7366]|uniref:uncharacterized protein n=1 Tax=Sodiomyces alcalophilus JCM 7366 TaxID=591952 RepID=UPI0039B6A83D
MRLRLPPLYEVHQRDCYGSTVCTPYTTAVYNVHYKKSLPRPTSALPDHQKALFVRVG